MGEHVNGFNQVVAALLLTMLTLVEHRTAQGLTTVLLHTSLGVQHHVARPARGHLEHLVLTLVLFLNLLTEELFATATTENELVRTSRRERLAVPRNTEIRPLTLGACEAELHP